jgi:uncharacterized protein YlxW (UPF0749 family)
MRTVVSLLPLLLYSLHRLHIALNVLLCVDFVGFHKISTYQYTSRRSVRHRKHRKAINLIMALRSAVNTLAKRVALATAAQVCSCHVQLN